MLQLRLLALPTLLLLSTPALAAGVHTGPNHNQIDGVRWDIHLDLEPYGFFGVGARVEFALVPDGFLDSVNDELALSLGADLFFASVSYDPAPYYPGGAWLVPVAAVQWNFYLGSEWSVFPELGLAVHTRFDQNGWTDKHGRDHRWIQPGLHAGVGARWHFSPSAVSRPTKDTISLSRDSR